MPFNPKDKNDILKLSKAVGYSYGRLRPFRQNRLSLMREMVGTHYSDNGAEKNVPLNLLELAHNIYLQRLAAQAPAVSITTDFTKLKEICVRFESAGNHLIKEINLGKTLRSAVNAAMNSIGIIKVGINLTKVEVGGYLHDTGQPFATFVGLDDWVHDMTVGNFENVQYEGDFYYPTLDEAYEIFPKKVHDKLMPRSQIQKSIQKDQNISEGSGDQREELIETIKCLDLWLPKQNIIVQCQVSDDDADPIAHVLNIIEDWDGPERGPYHKLGFGEVENNTMPLAPAMLIQDLHELANTTLRKLRNQSDRQKQLAAVQRGGEPDGEKVKEGEDGQILVMDNPNAVKQFKTGGITQEQLGFLLVVKDLFSYIAGNLDTLGGLGPQTDTVGQDQLLSVSASMRMQSMQKTTIEFTKEVINDLLYWTWTDPYTVFPATKSVKGFDSIKLSSPLRPRDRENDFMEYNIDIEPYSMQGQTPESKLQGIRTIFTEMIAPLIPAMQQQGITVDFQKLIGSVSKLGNIPELKDIFVFANQGIEQQPYGEMPQKAEPLAKPSVTTRNYTRRSIPGASNPGKSQIMQQALFGGKPQNSEVASLGRPTG